MAVIFWYCHHVNEITARERYLPRLADLPLDELVAGVPAVLITGPRAAGKTTSARRVAAEVVELDQPGSAATFVADPDAALRGRAEPLLLDEWQEVPGVLGAVKRAVDADPRPGRFILTGSVRADLQGKSWPGTGRLIRLPMTVLTEREVNRSDLGRPGFLNRLATMDLSPSPKTSDLSVLDYVGFAVRGSFPEVIGAKSERVRSAWLRSYVEQLVTRDASELISGTDPAKMRNYFEALSLNTAGLVADASLYQAVGITSKTAGRYDDLLSDLGVAVRVPAWSTNRLQRLEKRAKRYIVDGGLAAAGAGIDVGTVLTDADLLGRMIDTFVYAQIAPEAELAAQPVRLHHLRSANGRQEIDLVAELPGGKVVGIEIKAAAAVGRNDARHLAWLRDQLGDRFAAGVVLHTGPDTFELGDRILAAPISAIWT